MEDSEAHIAELAAKRKPNREGRGRLSSIDLLPAEADRDVAWAVEQLADRSRTESDILAELNDRLEVIGCEPISRSAFNRFSIRKMSALRRLNETREVANAVAAALGPDQGDKVTVLIAQLLKEATFAILEKGVADPKAVMELSRALASLTSAEKNSAVNAGKRTAQIDAEKDKAAVAAAGEIVRQRPELDGAAVLAAIRRAYGIGEASAAAEDAVRQAHHEGAA